jgi:hypothetical protein
LKKKETKNSLKSNYLEQKKAYEDIAKYYEEYKLLKEEATQVFEEDKLKINILEKEYQEELENIINLKNSLDKVDKLNLENRELELEKEYGKNLETFDKKMSEYITILEKNNNIQEEYKKIQQIHIDLTKEYFKSVETK